MVAINIYTMEFNVHLNGDRNIVGNGNNITIFDIKQEDVCTIAESEYKALRDSAHSWDRLPAQVKSVLSEWSEPEGLQIIPCQN